MFLSDKTSQALDEIVGIMFDLNRSFDRAVSIMQNKWCMPNAADIIHHKLAHLFPLLADEVSGFKDKCNVATIYPDTHRDDRDYDNLMSMMSTLLKEVVGAYDAIKLTYKVSREEGDLNANVMLQDLVEDMTDVISQITTLKDKAEQMPTDYDTYDAHIGHWGIVGLEVNG